MSFPTRAIIDLSALQHNLECVRKYVPQSSILAMIKSNAYGHGLIEIAKSLHDVDALGVARLDEGIRLCNNDVRNPIVLMSGFLGESELECISEFDIATVVHDPTQVETLERISLKNPIGVWMKIDTGMHRLGFSGDQVFSIYDRLSQCDAVKRPLFLMTHLADADDVSKKTTLNQIRLFEEMTKHLEGPKSIANSAGIVAWPESHTKWVRPGIMLYGISPLLDKTSEELNLKPVMTLTSRLIAIHSLKKGDCVGYGGGFKCPRNMRVGVVAIGYGDGYPRHAKTGTPVIVNDHICELIGRVSMDLISVDLQNCSQAKVGDEVELWGEHLPVERVAEFSDAIAYELLCNVSQRVHFVYKKF